MPSTPKRTGFFPLHAGKFHALAPGLRECQIGAFCAVRAHFSVSSEPCVISLPTGSGKTGLMMALAFGLKAHRSLIISPAEVLRVQTGDKFRTLEDLRLAGAVPELPSRAVPLVHSISSELRSKADWRALEAYDVVTATTRTTSPGMAQIAKPPPGLFDVVFIDEAHHAAAATWAALIRSFDLDRTKIILLTGTPYRRDHRSIGPAPRFVYPIARAINDGIYAPVGLVTAGKPAKDQRDTVLAQLGVRQLRMLRRKCRGKPLLLAKTDRTAHADRLGALYAEHGVKLGVVHSDQSARENERAITDARTGRSDGLVAVGMLGEGLDIPSLKVAVFHRNPQSLPYTLQIIGRIARTKAELPQGKVVACAEDFTRETFQLFEGSQDWLQLIPELEAMLIDRLAPRHHESVSDTGAEIQLADVSTHFSLTVYNIEKRPLQRSFKDTEFKFQRGWVRIVIDRTLSPGLRVIVSRTEEPPRWLRLHGSSAVSELRYHLHVFYTGMPNLLIQQSTEEGLAEALREKLADRGKPVPPGKLNHVMASARGDYIIVGLKNGAAISGLQPSYKMLMGHRVDGSITSTDGGNCHAGHCVTRIGTGKDAEFRGVAYKHSRVWTLDRDNLRVLGEWMKVVAEAIRRFGDAALPDLDKLRQPIPLVEFPGLPVAVLPSISALDKSIQFSHPPEPDVEGFPPLEAIKHTKRRLHLTCPTLGTQFIAEIEDGTVSFSENGKSGWQAHVTGGPIYSRRFALDDFLTEFPPILVFEDGSNWCDGIYTRPSKRPVLEPAILVATNWGHCVLTKELPSNPRTGNSIHEFVELQVQQGGVIAIRDHATGEVADYIAFNSEERMITLYHCKGAAAANPGVDQENIRELVTQGMTSCRWLNNRDLCRQLQQRMLDLASTRMVQGTPAAFGEIAAAFEPSDWRFAIALVQPGLSAKKITDRGGERMRAILACADDYIRAAGGIMKVLCS